MTVPHARFLFAICVVLLMLPCNVRGDESPEPNKADEISFHRQVRPVLQAKCQGCHQPAKVSGGYAMTEFAKLLMGGESEETAVVPGKPDESYLIDQITPVDGSAAMPPKGDPLSDVEIELIRTWIAQGAKDDTPASTQVVYSRQNPPVYSLPPVVTSLDYSPDGTLLAVAGFNEVLLHKADGSGIADRLVGLSERIESVRFSPDGKRLAVTGGQPGRMGEVQVWDVEKSELLLSHTVTFDTLYGASWSPDGELIAFGCADNSVRAINAESGEQVLFQGAHSDWVRDTAFTIENESPHVVSVSRDMTVKLTEVETNRFIDNVTSITPKALQGGVNSIVRHPERDEVVVGGADGTPKVYRVFRITARKIGDDSNLIKKLNPMLGRVFGVAVSRDGQRIAAVSALDGQGEVAVYSYEFDTKLPDDLKAISAKRVRDRKPEEQQKLDDYRSKDIKRIANVSIEESSLYGLAFHPNNREIAVAGGDGTIRLIETETGQIRHTFPAAPVSGDAAESRSSFGQLVWSDSPQTHDETVPEGATVVDLMVQPPQVDLSAPFDYTQLLISATLENGESIDVTRIATLDLSGDAVEITRAGFVRPLKDGESRIRISLADREIEVGVKVSGVSDPFVADFVRHVNPVLSRVGCNQGTCHGSAKGKNGFKLSLRGYDPIFDVRALTDDLASRRTNVSSPDDSLMLLKATGAVPHVGSQVIPPNSNYYAIVRNWIATGAKLNLATGKVVSIAISPQNPVIQQIGSTQQVRVVATYADGSIKDVTREAFIVSGNTEVAETNRWGLMTSIRRGEAPILARFEGAYAATTLTVMGDRTGFEWNPTESWGEIDDLVAAKWQRMKIQPSGLCTDAEFLRRIHLDLTGLPPTAEQVRTFLADDRDPQTKRAEVVDQLIGGDEFVEYWTNKWADLLQVNRKFLGPEGSAAFRDWIRSEVKANTPYDEFVRKVITAEGSNKDNPAASYYKILRTPEDIMENTTHLFLGVRFNCNKCHDHPFEKWTQDQYYETSAFFARVGLKEDKENSKNRKIGGTAVEGAKPFYEVVFEKTDGDVTHERTGAVAPPEFPYPCDFDAAEDMNRRQKLAAWISSADNQYFAKSYVNRLWGYLHGIGIMEPIDDIRAGNPPTNPQLLDYLTREFVQSQFNVQHVLKLICKSRTYQLSLDTNKWNQDDTQNYSHAMARRLPAEVLYDAIHRVTGAKSKIPGVPEGTRAAAIPDAGITLPDGFLANLGRPPRESACECERSAGLQLGPIMALIGGPTVGNAIDDPNNDIARLVKEVTDDRQLINELFVRIFNRFATDAEIDEALAIINEIDADDKRVNELLAERERWWKEEKPKLDAARAEAMANANAELAAYEAQIADRRAQEEQARVEKLAGLEADLNKYKEQLPAQAEAYLTKNNSDVEWHLLEPRDLAGPAGITLERLRDRSIKATGTADSGAYTVTVRTSLKDIAAFRVEAMTDESTKGHGPGLPENGNFVVTEFEVQAAPLSKPGEFKNIALQNAQADFLQAGFNAALTIDGNKGNQNGWAVANAGGVTHWATFESKESIGHDDGTVLKFVIHQNHNAKVHLLARFRISATTQKSPGLSLPESLRAIAQVEAAKRSESQTKTLMAWFEKSDATLVGKQSAVAEARKPLPEDPGVTERKERIAYVSQEIPEDSRLVRLRSDVEFSKKQVDSKRLTAAQDIAWALINNPAFLFNH